MGHRGVVVYMHHHGRVPTLTVVVGDVWLCIVLARCNGLCVCQESGRGVGWRCEKGQTKFGRNSNSIWSAHGQSTPMSYNSLSRVVAAGACFAI